MGSVIDYIECPNCKQEAYSDFYYKTGEEYVNCTNCGYHYSATIKDRTKSLNELDFEIIELKNPYGAYRIKYYDLNGYASGSLANDSEYGELRQHLSANESIEFASVSRLVDGEIVTEILVDNGPQTDSAGFTTEDR